MELLSLNIVGGIIAIIVGFVLTKRYPEQKALWIIVIIGLLDVIISLIRILLK